jgi:Bestrophin, RFP-TM, chloride channel
MPTVAPLQQLPLSSSPRPHSPPSLQMFVFKLSDAPVTLTGSIMVVLVTFRTNNAYLRFDEARKMWGLLLNRSRDVVRMAITFFPEDDMHRKATFARWTIATSQAMKCHLRPGEDLRKDLASVLCDEELDIVMTSGHKACTAKLCTTVCACISNPAHARLRSANTDLALGSGDRYALLRLCVQCGGPRVSEGCEGSTHVLHADS